MEVVRQFSAGGLPYRRFAGGIEYALGSHRGKRGFVWGFAKGAIEAGESPEEAALREVREETGLSCRIVRQLGETAYWYQWEGEKRHKRVQLYLMEYLNGDFEGSDGELSELAWLNGEEAEKRLTFAADRALFLKARALLQDD